MWARCTKKAQTCEKSQRVLLNRCRFVQTKDIRENLEFFLNFYLTGINVVMSSTIIGAHFFFLGTGTYFLIHFT